MEDAEITRQMEIAAEVMRENREVLRRLQARKILRLRGSGAWEGDLAEMRGDGTQWVHEGDAGFQVP